MAVSPWDRCRVWQGKLQPRIRAAVHQDQLNDVPRAKFYMQPNCKELNFHANDGTSLRASPRRIRGSIGSKSADDYCLRENFAQFLDITGDLADAPGERTKSQLNYCRRTP